MKTPYLCERDADFVCRFLSASRRDEIVKKGGTYKTYRTFQGWWTQSAPWSNRSTLAQRFHEIYFHVPPTAK